MHMYHQAVRSLCVRVQVGGWCERFADAMRQSCDLLKHGSELEKTLLEQQAGRMPDCGARRLPKRNTLEPKTLAPVPTLQALVFSMQASRQRRRVRFPE